MGTVYKSSLVACPARDGAKTLRPYSGCCSSIKIHFNYHGHHLCGWICEWSRINSMVFRDRTFHSVCPRNGHFNRCRHKLDCQLFGWTWICTTDACNGTLGIYNLHRLTSPIHFVCMVQGTRNEKQDH